MQKENESTKKWWENHNHMVLSAAHFSGRKSDASSPFFSACGRRGKTTRSNEYSGTGTFKYQGIPGEILQTVTLQADYL